VTDDYGTVGGGGSNQAGDNTGTTDDAIYATVGGGLSNTASGDGATVGGGDSNIASGSWATVGGGFFNTASGGHATVPGGTSNKAIGNYSFAAGYFAIADGGGSFVWGDASPVQEIHAWGVNQFVARATGGFWFVTAIDEGGVPIEGMHLPAGKSVWVPIGSTTTAAVYSTANMADDYSANEIQRENDLLRQRIDDLESRLALLENLVSSLYPVR
jgi:hypothetical protein